jgi:hypothetical protein
VATDLIEEKRRKEGQKTCRDASCRVSMVVGNDNPDCTLPVLPTQNVIEPTFNCVFSVIALLKSDIFT